MFNPPSNNRSSLTVSHQSEDPTVALIEPDLNKEEKLELEEREKELAEQEKKLAEQQEKDRDSYLGYLEAVEKDKWDRYQKKLDEEKKQKEAEEEDLNDWKKENLIFWFEDFFCTRKTLIKNIFINLFKFVFYTLVIPIVVQLICSKLKI
ncbi:hypothetical protein [Candidatus Mycoplasma haematohominis]|uniref:hypothetical protein n=1 Tax=Candidatus Mycoplasma haematohominis TaxID=1494318 RepID=UPI001C0A6AAA|nr:hypothetical protein [Candidatus Mycoplasma haemohominis]